jgi:N-acetylneuraminic acid mutarotase
MKLILFGGFDGVSYYNDTWACGLGTNTWTNLHPTGSVPAKRAGHSMAYDPVSKRMILFGGWNGTTAYDDTWAYDPAANTWANLRPEGSRPDARDSQCLSYDPDSKKMILFGGWSATAEFQDTWAYDPARNTWIDLDPAGEVPTVRAMQQMVYDPRAGQQIIFGGGSGANVFDDTWQFDTTTRSWTMVRLTGNSPPARTGYAMAYDRVGDRVVLFGGFNGSAFFNDLWFLNR